MIRIGKSSLTETAAGARLRADIRMGDGSAATLWFGVEAPRKGALCPGRADPFVLALLPEMLRTGESVTCEDPVSDRLLYQLDQCLLPALTTAGEGGTGASPRVEAAPAGRLPAGSGCGVVFRREDCFRRTLTEQQREPLCPLTHLMVPNLWGEAGREHFREDCRLGAEAARQAGLEAVFVDSGLDPLPGGERETGLFRMLACALAVQGLLSLCLLPTDRPAARFRLDPADPEGFALLLAASASTEALTFCPAGPERAMAAAKRAASGPPGTITVGRPYLEDAGAERRLCARVTFPDREAVMWFGVGREYGAYLTDDRADAFVAALLPAAMGAGADIVCQGPVSRRLLWQLDRYLLPLLTAGVSAWYPAEVRAAPADEALPCAGMVCTGGTGGVDSMFTILQDRELPETSRLRLTHLFLAGNGAIEGADRAGTLARMVDRARRQLAPETGLTVLGIDTNLPDVLPDEAFVQVLPFRHAAALLALQKLFGAALISSSVPYADFRIDGRASTKATLILHGCSTQTLRLYLSGGAFHRTEKVEQLAAFPLARRAVHPCILGAAEKNCGRCVKCVWLQATLYASGKLDLFREAFDIEDFLRKKNRRLAQLFFLKWTWRENAGMYAQLLRRLEASGENLLPARLLAAGQLLRHPRRCCGLALSALRVLRRRVRGERQE